ncbi:hypothetical protein GINT2_000424 [Glugoides intestinalis]
MKEFLDNSTLIFANIKELKRLVDEIEEFIRLKQTSVLTEDKEEALNGKLEHLDRNFDTVCKTTKDAIRDAQKKTTALVAQGELSKEEIEMRNLHIYKYCKDFSDAIYCYRNLKSAYNSREKELLAQAYKIVNPKASDEEIDKIVEDVDCETTLSTPFSVGADGSQQMLKQAKTRRKNIINVVTKINKLVALIEEIDEVVNNNIKIVDEIVVNVTTAEVNTMQANKELEVALATRRRLNSIKRFLLGVFMFIVGLFIVYWLLFARRRQAYYYQRPPPPPPRT